MGAAAHLVLAAAAVPLLFSRHLVLSPLLPAAVVAVVALVALRALRVEPVAMAVVASQSSAAAAVTRRMEALRERRKTTLSLPMRLPVARARAAPVA